MSHHTNSSVPIGEVSWLLSLDEESAYCLEGYEFAHDKTALVISQRAAVTIQRVHAHAQVGGKHTCMTGFGATSWATTQPPRGAVQELCRPLAVAVKSALDDMRAPASLLTSEGDDYMQRMSDGDMTAIHAVYLGCKRMLPCKHMAAIDDAFATTVASISEKIASS